MTIRKILSHRVFIAVAQFVVFAVCARGQHESTVATQDDFSASVSAWQSVDRWLLEYEARVVVENETGELGRTVHKRIACAKPDKFFHFMGHGRTWDAEPFNQLAILNGTQSVHLAPFLRRINVDKSPEDGLLPGTLSKEFAYYIMPMLACSKLHTGKNSTMLVLDAIGSDQYRIAQENCLVVGENCVEWRSVDDTESIWINKSKGPCVMQREHRDQATGQVLQRIQTTQTRQYSDKLWLPVRFSRSLYRVGDQGPHLLQTSDFRVLRFETDAQVPDSLFSWSNAPGMIQRQAAGNWQQVAPGGTELLESYVSYLQNEVYQPAHNHLASWRTIGGVTLLSVVLMVLIGVALKSFLRLRYRAAETYKIT